MSRVYDFGLGGQIPDSSTNFMLHPNGRALYPIGRSPMVCEISGGIGACRPAGSLPATRAALLAADYVVMPMQAEPAVIKRSYPDVLAPPTLLPRRSRTDLALSPASVATVRDHEIQHAAESHATRVGQAREGRGPNRRLRPRRRHRGRIVSDRAICRHLRTAQSDLERLS